MGWIFKGDFKEHGPTSQVLQYFKISSIIIKNTIGKGDITFTSISNIIVKRN